MRRWWPLLILLGGCISPTPPIHRFERMHLGVPVASADAQTPRKITGTCPYGHPYTAWENVWINPFRCYITPPAEKVARDGNCYSIRYYVHTNVPFVFGGETNQEAFANCNYLRTNFWPTFRGHIDLSVDGGTTWVRRIGYGVQRDPSRVGGELIWSPPYDPSLMTETAKLRITDLDGQPFDNGSTNFAFNLKPGEYVESYGFSLIGARITQPVQNDVLYYTSEMSITLQQAGGGPVWDVGWIQPDDLYFHPITTLSNVASGYSSHTFICSVPVCAQAKIVIRSAQDPALIARSGTVSVE